MLVESKKVFPVKFIHIIFEISVFLDSFRGGRTVRQAINLLCFEIFLIFPKILSFEVVWKLVRQLAYTSLLQLIMLPFTFGETSRDH